jgi:hypothetical protein
MFMYKGTGPTMAYGPRLTKRLIFKVFLRAIADVTTMALLVKTARRCNLRL